MESLTRLIPEIEGWSVDEAMMNKMTIRPFYMRDNEWRIAIVTGAEPLVISRSEQIGAGNNLRKYRCLDYGL